MRLHAPFWYFLYMKVFENREYKVVAKGFFL
jgi:hypothetical protein